MRSVLCVFAATALFASDVQAPSIPIDVEAEYYRADAQVAHLKPLWDAANTDLQAAVAAVQKICGEKYAATANGKHLVCAVKPEK